MKCTALPVKIRFISASSYTYPPPPILVLAVVRSLRTGLCTVKHCTCVTVQLGNPSKYPAAVFRQDEGTLWNIPKMTQCIFNMWGGCFNSLTVKLKIYIRTHLKTLKG